MSKRDANQVLMAHWTHSWTTLGRWQELNARLSRETSAPTSGWMRTAAGARLAELHRPAASRFSVGVNG